MRCNSLPCTSFIAINLVKMAAVDLALIKSLDGTVGAIICQLSELFEWRSVFMGVEYGILEVNFKDMAEVVRTWRDMYTTRNNQQTQSEETTEEELARRQSIVKTFSHYIEMYNNCKVPSIDVSGASPLLIARMKERNFVDQFENIVQSVNEGIKEGRSFVLILYQMRTAMVALMHN